MVKSATERFFGVVGRALGLNPDRGRSPGEMAGVMPYADDLEPDDPNFGMSSHRRVDALLKEWTRSAQYAQGQIWDYNPDDLVQDKGRGVEVYQDMRRDPYVKAALHIKKTSVARLPRRILPASSDPLDQEIAEFVEWTLENMETSFDTTLWGMMDAVDVGYSIGEQNFRIVDHGRFAGKVGLKSIKSKDPVAFTFQIARNGDVEKVVQRMFGGFDDDDDRELDNALENHDGNDDNVLNFGSRSYPPEKFVICSFQPLYANPYGNSDLRAAYRAFFIKDWAWKFRSIFMEKAGMPTVIGRYPNGILEARRKRLEAVMDSIQNDTVITIPEDLKIEILKIAGEGRVTEYERAIADLNKEILIGILGSFLSVEEGKRTGARAAGQVHLQVSKLFIEHLARMMSECVNRQIIRRIVDINYDVDRYPKFAFEISKAAEQLVEVEVDQALKELGVPLDPKYLYEKYERPTPSESTVDGLLGRDAGVPVPPALPPVPDPAAPPPAIPEPPGDPNKPDPFNTAENVTELKRLKENFIVLREEALPADPQKIGPLKETYTWFFKGFEATIGRKKFGESSDRAFQMAGFERTYRLAKGHWMDSNIAWEEFLKAGFRG